HGDQEHARARRPLDRGHRRRHAQRPRRAHAGADRERHRDRHARRGSSGAARTACLAGSRGAARRQAGNRKCWRIVVMRWTGLILAGACMSSLLTAADQSTTEKAREYIASFAAKVRPLDIAVNRAWWDANITGKDEDFAKKEQA